MTAPDEPQEPQERPEYDRFEDLAKRLVKVPKRELDEARERERSGKG